MKKKGGRYRIQAVSEMTGLPAATLRSWERRYGIPLPARTSSSYRLYSDDDVQLISRLRDLTRSGIAPAEAARVVLAAQRAAERKEQAEPDADPYLAAQDRMIDAALRYDLEELETEMRTLVLTGSATLVTDRVFLPVLRRVGEMWSSGEMSVGQEHLLSEVAQGFCRQVLQLIQPMSGAHRALLACFDEEQHVMPLWLVSLHFAQWGYRTVVLGARTPPEAIAEGVEALEPDLVGLSVTIPPEEARGEELARAYAEACGKTPWVVGGSGLTDGLRQIITDNGGRLADQDMLSVREVLRNLEGKRRRGGRRKGG